MANHTSSFTCDYLPSCCTSIRHRVWHTICWRLLLSSNALTVKPQERCTVSTMPWCPVSTTGHIYVYNTAPLHASAITLKTGKYILVWKSKFTKTNDTFWMHITTHTGTYRHRENRRRIWRQGLAPAWTELDCRCTPEDKSSHTGCCCQSSCKPAS